MLSVRPGIGGLGSKYLADMQTLVLAWWRVVNVTYLCKIKKH